MMDDVRRNQHIVMLGTRSDTRGGIAAVVNAYAEAGLFTRYPVLYLATHCDGSRAAKLHIAVAAWWRYLSLLLRRRVMLVHVHSASGPSFWRKSLFLFPALLFRTRIVFHLHGGGFARFYGERSTRLSGWLIRFLLDRADRIVVLSDSWKQWVRSVSRNPQVWVIANPVALPVPSGTAAQVPGTILFLGRLHRAKGVHDLLSAVAQIATRHPGMRLVLAGDGEQQPWVHMAQELGIGRQVRFAGWVKEQAKRELLRQATVFVLPSYTEALPMSVLEAMAAGLPVVTTSIGGLPELVTDGVDGCLLQPGDVARLAALLERLLTDAPLRHTLGSAARRKVEENFSIDVVMPKLHGLYRELGCEGPPG